MRSVLVGSAGSADDLLRRRRPCDPSTPRCAIKTAIASGRRDGIHALMRYGSCRCGAGHPVGSHAIASTFRGEIAMGRIIVMLLVFAGCATQGGPCAERVVAAGAGDRRDH